MKQPLCILSCRSEASDALEQAVARLCSSRGIDVLLVPHLYHLAEQSPLWELLAGKVGERIVLFSWLYPRPAKWLLQRHGIRPAQLVAVDLREHASAESCLAAVEAELGPLDGAASTAPGAIRQLDEPVDARWYPIVDSSRCVNCQHCLQFCLFGVYGTDEQGKLIARNPDACKSGCPACSRICPEGAIMFALYDKDQAIAGAPGRFMTLDAAARRMFYMRTAKACPKCGQVLQRGAAAPAPGEAACPECGGRLADAPAKPAEPAKPAYDDLDELVDRLDHRMHRRK